MYTATLCASH